MQWRSNSSTGGRSKRLWPWLLLAYQFIFLNVILPGHTRGAITLDGKHTPCPMCCCCGTQAADKASMPSPSPRDRDNCALCSFAARLTFYVPPNLRLTDFQLVEILPPAPAPTVVVCPPARVETCRGPPSPIA